MKRRDFLLNSLVAIGGSMLFAGCSKKNATKNFNDGISRRNYNNLSIPLLALGCMRLPNKDGVIDQNHVQKMVDYAMKHGVNYFDTAYMYMNGKSENSIGKALKKYDRKSFFLADKNPLMMLMNEDDVLKIFNEQLEKCQVEYFDFYMAHNINKNTVKNYHEFNVYDKLNNLKKEGKIKYLGFSFHGDPILFEQIINEHKWDFCQIQMNYFDWTVLEAQKMYALAKQKGVKVIVMEPLRGGGLCTLNQKATDLLKMNLPTDTPTSYALRWLAGKDNVLTILSGMSNIEQLQQNIETLSDYKPLSQKEEDLANQLTLAIKSQGEINCTACKYCVEGCPRGVDIPKIFTAYNVYTLMKNSFLFVNEYESIPENQRVSACIDCGICKKHCPQGLDIPNLLKTVEARYNKIKSKMA